MARRLDIVNVVDVEATCWENEPPPGQINEIIEIGLTEVDVAKLEIKSSNGFIVKPKNSKISEFCTRLTGLTQTDVNKSQWTLELVCRDIKRLYKTKNRTWLSWGDYDRNQFQRQCRNEGIIYPFGPSHINLKNVLAICELLPKEQGMYGILKRFNMKMKGRHHRGIDDSYMIALIYIEFLRRYREHRSFGGGIE